ncbi:MAG TPA: AtpZ/AtpI family protein [Cyclobacteriaceae bacterium]|nr:AtpZ/AtpI family protein [Cyclobacteriaceae bacterium]
MKYSGLAIQMLITIGLAGWAGYALDKWIGWKFPAAMLGFILIAFAGTIYQLYRSLNRDA